MSGMSCLGLSITRSRSHSSRISGAAKKPCFRLATAGMPQARSAFIFPGQNGSFLTLSGAERRLQSYRKACGVEGVTFYKFRHTMCTRLVLAGQPLSVIQRIMGDNSPDVITRVYTHVGADSALRAMRGYLGARGDETQQCVAFL